MNLAGTTCIGLGVSRVWWDSVICPLRRVKKHLLNQNWGTGHATAAEPEVGLDLVTPTEPEVVSLVQSWIPQVPTWLGA